MKVRIVTRFALLALLACAPEPEPAPYDGSVTQGETVSLGYLVTEAGSSPVTWSLSPDSIGTIDQRGWYTAPNCSRVLSALAAPDLSVVGQIRNTDTVLATWSGGSRSISVVVEERVLSLQIVPEVVNVEIGGTVQFHVEVAYTCHTARS